MAQQTDHIGDTNKMVEHHIVDTNKMITMAQQTAVEWLIDRLLDGSIRFEETEMGFLISMENGDEIDKAKAMEKQQIRDALILFCDTESYGACDIKDWVKNNGIIFKNKDTNSQIVYRVDYFVDNILNHNI